MIEDPINSDGWIERQWCFTIFKKAFFEKQLSV
jgi:hypothetical protein